MKDFIYFSRKILEYEFWLSAVDRIWLVLFTVTSDGDGNELW